jgi:hypothetical protein
MSAILARNVNSAWPQGVRLLKYGGHRRQSRNGAVVEYPSPVTTTYECPWERALFDPARDANPFFHLFEGLWILAGRNDVEWPAQFAGRLREYSDDGKTFHGAYGHRLRRSRIGDQLAQAERLLKDDPDTRRVVLSLWDAEKDLSHDGKDVPCNTQLYVKAYRGRLRMTVCNRSNDIVWGLYGANAVQWSMVQEYLAEKAGLKCGTLTTLSDSFHAYESNEVWKFYMSGQAEPSIACPYEAGLVAAYPLMDAPKTFDAELERFLNDPLDELADMFPDRAPYRNSFFWVVAQPMYRAWKAHKDTKTGLQTLEEGSDATQTGRAIDWIEAARAWLSRREGHAERTKKPAVGARPARRSGARRLASQVRG